MKNELFKLAPKDAVKGLILSVLTVIVTSVTASLNVGTIPTTKEFWVTQLTLGLSAGGAYLLKNFLTNSDDQFLKKEAKA